MSHRVDTRVAVHRCFSALPRDQLNRYGHVLTGAFNYNDQVVLEFDGTRTVAYSTRDTEGAKQLVSVANRDTVEGGQSLMPSIVGMHVLEIRRNGQNERLFLGFAGEREGVVLDIMAQPRRFGVVRILGGWSYSERVTS